MKSQTKNFDTVFNGNLFHVEYELNQDGTKQLMYVTLAAGDLPIDIADLFGSSKPYHKELYEHVINAMNNNAMSQGKLISDVLSGMMSNITNGYAKTHGIQL